MTLGSCLSSYTAKNIGAGKTERIPLGFRTGLKLSEFTALPFVMLYFIFSRQMMGLFLGAESVEAISAGMAFLKIIGEWYFMNSVIKLMTDGIIRGSGAMVYFVVATVPDLIFENRICTRLDKKFWKYRNLDGMAIWLDRSDHINIDRIYKTPFHESDQRKLWNHI